MEFYALNSALKRLSASETLDLNTALEAMSGLCMDLQKGFGVRIQNGSVGDYENLLDRLCALSALVIRIYDTHSRNILELTDETLPGKCYYIQQEVQGVKEQLEKQKAVRMEMAKAADEKASALEALDEELRRAKEEECRLACLTSELEAKLQELRGIDLTALEQRAGEAQLRLQEIQTKERSLNWELKTLQGKSEEKAHLLKQLWTKKAELAPLGEAELDAEIDRLKNRSDILNGISEQLIESARELDAGIVTTEISDLLNMNRQYAARILDMLRDSICSYTDALADSIPGADA